MKKIEEDAPVNSAGGGQVASVNPPSVDPGMPAVFNRKGMKPILKRKILQSLDKKKG